MTHSINRRDMMKSAAAVGTGLFLGTGNRRAHAAANEKIDLAFIGICLLYTSPSPRDS